MSSASRTLPARRRSAAPEAVRARILAAFSERAKRSGIRSVVMGELATQLRMSASTLYKHFPSKDALVAAMCEAWAEEIYASQGETGSGSVRTALEGLLTWADTFAESLAEVSPALLEDLQRDHPQSWQAFCGRMEQLRAKGAALLHPHLREDVEPGVALVALGTLLDTFSRPDVADRMGLTRRAVIREALIIWARGSLGVSARLIQIGPEGATDAE